ncbi:hypothetical protein AB0D34_23075 [Streptomyces sp. NPDC048420]|uniref:hypothetical protein n=1 Tax=Streptomyces sp. NPDC048420 TaxID=3155755 RepID=UPI003423B3C9
MSDQNTTDNLHATDVEDETPVTTDNLHATSEPVKPTTLKADDGTAEAGTDNLHATDEPV